MLFVEECYRGSRVRVFRFNRERSVAQLRQKAAEVMTACPEVIEVRLFGSMARGTATPGSDADLFILVKDGAAPFLERSAQLARYFEGAGVGCDILAYTESEWRQMRQESRRIVATILDQGIVLACRHYRHDGPSPRGEAKRKG